MMGLHRLNELVDVGVALVDALFHPGLETEITVCFRFESHVHGENRVTVLLIE